jgi:hypothetical protein
MFQSNSSAQVANPLAPLGGLAHWLTNTAALMAIGLIVGVAAARLIRARGLHWTPPPRGSAAPSAACERRSSRDHCDALRDGARQALAQGGSRSRCGSGRAGG